MFQLSSEKYYQVSKWTELPWLSHGFGTRDSKAPERPLATVKQVHGREVAIAAQEGTQGTGDGLISDTYGLLVGVKTADCLPILLVDFNHKVVAAVHAGWRGTGGGIVSHTVELMKEQFGSKPAEMEAAIGPGIGQCCFEVGPEVAREFGPWDSEEKTFLDLSRVNRQQLLQAGVEKVYESRLCTMCGTGFYSYRREREQAGRMLSFVGRVL